MLNHLVGHVVGRCHQFPEKYANVKLNEQALVSNQMSRIEMELKQRRSQHAQENMSAVGGKTIQHEVMDPQREARER